MTNVTRRTSRRGPTTEQLRVWRAFVETTAELRSVLGSRMQAASGLSSGDYAVLLALSEAGGRRLRSSELADEVAWERSRLSHHLGRMERRGLVRREPCETDNRGAWVVLTPSGADAFRRSSVTHLHDVRELFVDALTVQQLAAVADATAALQARLPDRRRAAGRGREDD
ncbi:MarR family winged helix-turn-helix transcriptional regulator [Jiangella mangrovi]|uniref:DNA-binding MarR family transcriptional regulator n=1 Tax=Jiangella mangrovi TaxID=1524084 RepID=A0A7W9GUA8_9ACTN|nr:MarR family transcriptional regulator [Jiangella mangrovi]MBB5790175.1 DNA-binding MarR family transcriptional regulator [Jiangella mangrovi]